MEDVPNSDPNLLHFRRFGLDDSASDEIVRHDPFFNREPRPPSFGRPRLDDSALNEVGVVEGLRSYPLLLSSLSSLGSEEVRELLSSFKVSGGATIFSTFSKIKISTGAAVDYPLYGSPRLRVLFDITGAPSGKSGSGRSLFIEGGSNVLTIGSEWGSFDGTSRERLPFKKLLLRAYQFQIERQTVGLSPQGQGGQSPFSSSNQDLSRVLPYSYAERETIISVKLWDFGDFLNKPSSLLGPSIENHMLRGSLVSSGGVSLSLQTEDFFFERDHLEGLFSSGDTGDSTGAVGALASAEQLLLFLENGLSVTSLVVVGASIGIFGATLYSCLVIQEQRLNDYPEREAKIRMAFYGVTKRVLFCFYGYVGIIVLLNIGTNIIYRRPLFQKFSFLQSQSVDAGVSGIIGKIKTLPVSTELASVIALYVLPGYFLIGFLKNKGILFLSREGASQFLPFYLVMVLSSTFITQYLQTPEDTPGKTFLLNTGNRTVQHLVYPVVIGAKTIQFIASAIKNSFIKGN